MRTFNLGINILNKQPEIIEWSYEQIAEISTELSAQFDKISDLVAIHNSLLKYGKTKQLSELVEASLESMNINFSTEGIISSIKSVYEYIKRKLIEFWNWITGFFTKQKKMKEYATYQYAAHTALVKAMQTNNVEQIKKETERISTLYSGMPVDSILNSLKASPTYSQEFYAITPELEIQTRNPDEMKSLAEYLISKVIAFKKITENIKLLTPTTMSEELIEQLNRELDTIDLSEFTDMPPLEQREYSIPQLLYMSETYLHILNKIHILTGNIRDDCAQVKIRLEMFSKVSSNADDIMLKTFDIYKRHCLIISKLLSISREMFGSIFKEHQVIGKILIEKAKSK